MSSNRIHSITLGGVLAAAIVLATTIVSIPIPGGLGYVNLGDAAVLLSATLLGTPWGILCGGIASALSDLLLGYGVYAPATFIIKGGMAALFLFLSKRFPKRIRFAAYYLASLCVPIGYLVYESILYGMATASVNLGFNCLQGIIGATIAIVLERILMKTDLLPRAGSEKHNARS